MQGFFRKNALIGAAELICRLPLIFTVGYLARSVGAEVFGNWALIVAFQVFIASVAGLGLSSSLSRFVPSAAAGQRAAYLRFAFVLGAAAVLFLGTLTYALRTPIGALLSIPAELRWLIPVAILLAAGSVSDGFLDAFLKASMTVGRQIGFIVARTLIEIMAVVVAFVVAPPFLDAAPQLLMVYVVVVFIGKLVIYPVLLIGMTSGDRFPSLSRGAEFLTYGLPMVPTTLAMWLVSQSDRLVLSHFVTKAELGVYAFGASLAAYTVFLGYAVYPLLLPTASKLQDADDTDGVRVLFQNAQKLFMLIWAVAMTVLALWSHDIVVWTGGAAFAAAATVLVILAFAAGLDQLTGVYQYVFHLVKRTDLIFALTVGQAVLILIGLSIAGALGGVVWAPWAVLVTTLTYAAIRYAVARRHLDIAMPRELLFQVPALAICTALLAHYATGWNAMLRLFITAIALFSVVSYIFQRRNVLTAGALS